MAKETKPRKLMPKEREYLKKLEREQRDKQLEYIEALDLVERSCTARINAATRAATKIVSDVSKVFQGEKKKIDKWKDQALKRVERDYQEQLNALRERKSFACKWVEESLNEVKANQTKLAENDRRRLEEAHTAFLSVNRAKQEEVRFGGKPSPKQEKPAEPAEQPEQAPA